MTLNVSLLCHYPIRAIICKNFPNQSTSEACNAPWLNCYKLAVAWLLSCHMEIWTQLPQEALGHKALGLPVSTVSISHIWHSEAMLQLLHTLGSGSGSFAVMYMYTSKNFPMKYFAYYSWLLVCTYDVHELVYSNLYQRNNCIMHKSYIYMYM